MSELRLSLQDDGGQGHCALRLGYWKLVLNEEGGSRIPEPLLVLWDGPTWMRPSLVETSQDWLKEFKRSPLKSLSHEMCKQSWVTTQQGHTYMLATCFVKPRLAFCVGRFLVSGGGRRKTMALG